MKINKNNKNAIVCGLAIMSMLAFSGCASQNETKQVDSKNTVATVNMQTVMENHPDMGSAQDKMKSEYDKIRNDIKDTEGLPADKRQTKVMEAQKKLQDLEKETMTPIQTSVNNSIDEVMKSKGIATVVDKRVVVRGGTDITKDVLLKEGLSEEQAQHAIDSEKNNSNSQEE